MYIAVCDDQAEELTVLTALLEQWQTERRIPLRCRVFRSAGDMLDAARHERFTLYLLDVMMPGIDGMEAAREIRTFDAAADIVFLTSSPGFAYESYGVRALEYLLKPISGKHLYFNMTDGQVREVVGSLKDYEALLLARPEFMRIHRSYIVNMLQIDELSPAGVHTFSGISLPVSRLLYPQLQKDYMKLLFAEREDA